MSHIAPKTADQHTFEERVSNIATPNTDNDLAYRPAQHTEKERQHNQMGTLRTIALLFASSGFDTARPIIEPNWGFTSSRFAKQTHRQLS